MKFSEIPKEKWEELSPYLDTCLLPVTGISTAVQPFEATEWLERLRDIMDLIEIPFKGRVVTYPAWHYIPDHELLKEQLNEWCNSMKIVGFRYVILVTANKDMDLSIPSADLWFGPNVDDELPLQLEVSNAIKELWNGQNISNS